MSEPRSVPKQECTCGENGSGWHDVSCPAKRNPTSNLVSALQKLGNAEGESWVTLRDAEAAAVCAELSKLHSEHVQDVERMERAAETIERLRPMAESWESYEAAQERKAEMDLTDETIKPSNGMTPGQRDTHIRWLTKLLEYYSGEEMTLRARLDEREVWGEGHENEWLRYRAEAAALRAAIDALSGDSSTPETRSPPSRAAYDARGDYIRQLQEALSQLWSDVWVGGGYRTPTKEKVLAALKVQPEPSVQETSRQPTAADLERMRNAMLDDQGLPPEKASAHPVAVCGKLDQRGLHCQNPPGHEGDCDGMPF